MLLSGFVMYLTTPSWPRKLCVQYCLVISHILIVESLPPVAKRLDVRSKDIHDIGATWIA